jgi:hypothetical protein
MLLKFCRFSRLIQVLTEVHPKKEEKIGACSPVVGLGLSCLVGCFVKVELVERVSMNCSWCIFQGGDSGLAGQRLWPGVFPWPAIELDDSRIHPESGQRLFSLAEVSGSTCLSWRLRSLGAGDSGLSDLGLVCVLDWTTQ